MNDYTIKKPRAEIDALSRKSGFSRSSGAITSLYQGIDHRRAGSFYQKNTDYQGLTFFTRPYLNLSYNNVLADRNLMNLLDPDVKTKWRAIRAYLDPRGNYRSELVDNKSAFINLLSNTLLSVSGFPDVTVNSFTSPEGLRKESFSMVDDVAEINGVYDITATFMNIQGDPITTLFHTWAKYMGNVYMGDQVPYPNMVVENRIDYQTRIWRLVLDSTKTYVKRIGCANVCFPVASPLGAVFNYSSDQPYSEENNQISIPFRCMGAEYDDPILYLEFNDTVAMFNPAMVNGRRESTYHRLENNELDAFNYIGYPWINTTTLQLEWWVDKQQYELFKRELIDTESTLIFT